MNAKATPPCVDVALEDRYLGACMADGETIVEHPVPPRVLWSPSRRTVLESIVALKGRGEPTDATSVTVELDRRGQLGKVGGAKFIEHVSRVAELFPAALASRLVELAKLRATREAALRAVALAEAGDLLEARAELARVALEEDAGDDPVLTFREMLATAVEALTDRGQHRFVSFGMPSVDGVFRAGPGDLVVVGAATNTGKSTLLATWTISLARRGVPVGIVSIEDGAEDFGAKGLTAISSVPSEALWSGALSREQLDQMLRAIDVEGDLPISFTKIRSRTVEGVVSRMAYMARVRGCKIICVDYLQAVRGGAGKDTREKVNDTLAQLMAAAATLGVTLVLASQLRRGEGSKHHEPHDGELKESGDIENSAQCIVLLWRETDDESDPRYGVVYGKVAKVKRAAAGRRFWLRRDRSSGLYVEQHGDPPERVSASNQFLPRSRR